MNQKMISVQLLAHYSSLNLSHPVDICFESQIRSGLKFMESRNNSSCSYDENSIMLYNCNVYNCKIKMLLHSKHRHVATMLEKRAVIMLDNVMEGPQCTMAIFLAAMNIDCMTV
jgi:hypothetical protein